VEHQQAIAQALRDIDPSAFLLADHAWLRVVLDALDPGSGQYVDLHEKLEQLVPSIELHIRQEEEFFFPAVEPVMKELGTGSTEDMYGEHDAIRIRIDELFRAFHSPTDINRAYDSFVRSLLVHFENEEELIFAEAPSHLSEMTRREVIAQIEASMTRGFGQQG